MSVIEFTGQAAIVTGAGEGIGRATALALGARGAAVLVNDADPELAGAVAAEIRAAGGVAQAETTPVGGHDAARAIAGAATQAFGRIDILVNNAGIASPGAFGVVADEAIDRVLEVNLLGSFALMRAVWPAMTAQGYGRIVNTSSNAALGTGISGPYAASKAGIIGLTKDAALSGEALGVKVNAIMPSASTRLLDKHPDPAFRDWMARHMPAELAAVVTVYLASRACAATGEIFTAGGGRVCRLAFLESPGILDPALTPEAVAAAMPRICDLAGGSPVTFLRDHWAGIEAAFPD
jgi:NAD(P)-dependent dehydrogenase (short-subunit alcohol dehydrogenase family)